MPDCQPRSRDIFLSDSELARGTAARTVAVQRQITGASWEPVCKPGSVESSHSSGTHVTMGL